MSYEGADNCLAYLLTVDPNVKKDPSKWAETLLYMAISRVNSRIFETILQYFRDKNISFKGRNWRMYGILNMLTPQDGTFSELLKKYNFPQDWLSYAEKLLFHNLSFFQTIRAFILFSVC